MPISRITLFSVPDPADVPAVVARYTGLAAHATKDSRPYMLAAKASPILPDPAGRNQGYTVCANTVFASLDDMRFYDDHCPAHKDIKAFLKPRVHAVMTVYMEADSATP